MARRSKESEQSNVNPDDEANCLKDLTELKIELSKAMQPVARVRQKISSMWGRYQQLGIDKERMLRVYEDSLLDDPQAEWEKRTALAARLSIIKVEVDWEADGQGAFKDFGRSLQMASEESLNTLHLGRTRADGYNSGLAGGLRENNPAEPGTEHHVTWDAAWREGNEDRELAGKGDVEKASPRKRTSREQRVADQEAELTATDA
jgi:ribosome modulation factor